MSKIIKVTSAQVSAARRIVERSISSGEDVSDAVRKLAQAMPEACGLSLVANQPNNNKTARRLTADGNVLVVELKKRAGNAYSGPVDFQMGLSNGTSVRVLTPPDLRSTENQTRR